MDVTKRYGRDVVDLAEVFAAFPEAGFCLDVAHVWTNDPTLRLGHDLLDAFGERLRQLHVSGIEADGTHRPTTAADLDLYEPLLDRCRHVPVAARGGDGRDGMRRSTRSTAPRTRRVHGSGKTSAGRPSRSPVGRRFVDLDERSRRGRLVGLRAVRAARRGGVSRAVEEEVAQSVLSGGDPLVVALGGGAVLSERTRALLAARAFTVLLDVDPESACGSGSPARTGRSRGRGARSARCIVSASRVYDDVADARAQRRRRDPARGSGRPRRAGAIDELGEPRARRRACRARRRRARLGHPRHPRAGRARGAGRSGSTRCRPGRPAKTPAVVERLWSRLRIGRDGSGRRARRRLDDGRRRASPPRRTCEASRGRPCRRRSSARSTRESAARPRSTCPAGRTSSARSTGRRASSATRPCSRRCRRPSGGTASPRSSRRGSWQGSLSGSAPSPMQVRACAAFKSGVCLGDPHERRPAEPAQPRAHVRARARGGGRVRAAARACGRARAARRAAALRPRRRAVERCRRCSRPNRPRSTRTRVGGARPRQEGGARRSAPRPARRARQAALGRRAARRPTCAARSRSSSRDRVAASAAACGSSSTAPPRDVLVCHCSLCRRSGTLAGAYTSVARDALSAGRGGDARVVRRRERSPARLLRRVRRDALLVGGRGDTISMSAGALDGPTGLVTERHIFRRGRGRLGVDPGDHLASPAVRIDVLNGVNLDLLGRRDAAQYGDALAAGPRDAGLRLGARARRSRCGAARRTTRASTSSCSTRRSTMRTGSSSTRVPGRHYSWAIRDALEPFRGVVVEVHLSDVDNARSVAKAQRARGA